MRAAVLASVAVFATAVPAAARPGHDVEVDFFAEPAMTTQVGSQTLSCGGGVTHTGRRTAFYSRSSSPCENTHPPPSGDVSCNFTQDGCSPNLLRKRALHRRHHHTVVA